MIEYSREVKEAIELGKPIVALESTIISHGMPYPQNVETAQQCEQIVRDEGAVPATIAIIGGTIKIGLSETELDYFGKEGTKIHKVSRRDFGFVLSKKMDGALTVSATMYAASLVGIEVFATGGIGGVHRHAETTFDISADLDELSKTPVCVVCAGAKAILDLPLTLEYLETKGVEVIGYQTDKLPAFYSRTSHIDVPFRLDTPGEIASLLNVKKGLGLKTGTLVTNPIPLEHSLDFEEMDKVIEKAISKMDSLGIKGKDSTPFLLKEIVDLTGGTSLESNIALVYNNCRLASRIAIGLKEDRR
jgi:pseudouridine-5'-phosphate glycosidase